MIEKEAFIAALLPICDTVCEYDRTRGKLRVRKTSLASGLEDKWYTVEELRDIFRDNGGVLAEKSVWMRYLSSENLFLRKGAKRELSPAVPAGRRRLPAV